jgi:hypothetical protein
MDYDRRSASGTPVNRLREAGTYLHQAEREIERTSSIIKGLYGELQLVARHTHDKNIRANFDYVQDLKERTEKTVKDLKQLMDLYDEAAHEFR